MKLESLDRKARHRLTLLLVAGICVFGALDLGALYARLDMTRDKVYTLTEVSKKLVRELPDQLKVTYFVSAKVEEKWSFPSQLDDLLGEYRVASGGKLRYEKVDPSDQATQARIEQLGLKSTQIQIVEENQATAAVVYSGVLVEYMNRTRVLPFVSQVEDFEARLSQEISRCVSAKDPSVGLLVGDVDKTVSEHYAYLQSQLEQAGYSVKTVSPQEEIPAGLGALIVLGCAGLDAKAAERIDAFVMGGGRLLAAVKGLQVTSYGSSVYAQPLQGNPFLAMLASWGAEVKGEMVLDKNTSIAVPVKNPLDGRTGRMIYPPIFDIDPKSVPADNPITSRFAGFTFYWASPIAEKAVEGVKAEALMSSMPDSWRMVKDFNANPDFQSISAMADMASQTAGSSLMAVALTGNFPNFSPAEAAAAKPTSPEKPTASAATLPAKSPDTRMIVIGDSDCATNTWAQQNNGLDLQFFERAADWLSSDDSLLSIKSRGTRDLSLSKITDPAQKLGAESFIYVLNLGLVPAAVVAFGLWRLLRRRALAKQVYAAKEDSNVVQE